KEVLFEYRIVNGSRNMSCNIPENRRELIKYICNKHRDTYINNLGYVISEKDVTILDAWRQAEESVRWSVDLEKRLSVAEAEARQSWQNARDVWRQVEESGRWSAELEKRLSAAEAEARQWLQNAQEALQKVEESGRKSADLEKRISVAEAETQKWLQNAQEALGKQAETNRRLMEKEQNIAALLNSRDYRLGRALNWPVRKLLSRK